MIPKIRKKKIRSLRVKGVNEGYKENGQSGQMYSIFIFYFLFFSMKLIELTHKCPPPPEKTTTTTTTTTTENLAWCEKIRKKNRKLISSPKMPANAPSPPFPPNVLTKSSEGRHLAWCEKELENKNGKIKFTYPGKSSSIEVPQIARHFAGRRCLIDCLTLFKKKKKREAKRLKLSISKTRKLCVSLLFRRA